MDGLAREGSRTHFLGIPQVLHLPRISALRHTLREPEHLRLAHPRALLALRSRNCIL